jgi:hypothetical protein
LEARGAFRTNAELVTENAGNTVPPATTSAKADIGTELAQQRGSDFLLDVLCVSKSRITRETGNQEMGSHPNLRLVAFLVARTWKRCYFQLKCCFEGHVGFLNEPLFS